MTLERKCGQGNRNPKLFHISLNWTKKHQIKQRNSDRRTTEDEMFGK